jgi:hypothetical protein
MNILPAHYGYSMPIHCMWLILPAHYGYSMPIHCMRLILPAHYGYSMPIHCMRLILPAHYGYSMPMASPEGAMPPSSMTPAHYIMASLKVAMPLIIKFPRQASI